MSIRNNNVGVSYPFRFGTNGRVQTVGGRATEVPTVRELDRAVLESAHMIVGTDKGERVMLGQFGVGAGRFLFNPLGSALSGFLEQDAREQLTWFCGRAQPEEVRALFDHRASSVVVALRLIHNGFNSESAFKFRIGSSE